MSYLSVFILINLKSNKRNVGMDFARSIGLHHNPPLNPVWDHPDVMVHEDVMVNLANLVTSAVGD